MTFRLGLYCGLVLPFLYTVLRLVALYPWLDGIFGTPSSFREYSSCCLTHTDHHRCTEGPAIISAYRGMALLILILVFIGINIEIWVRSKINFLFVFELDPRTQPSGLAEFEVRTHSPPFGFW